MSKCYDIKNDELYFYTSSTDEFNKSLKRIALSKSKNKKVKSIFLPSCVKEYSVQYLNKLFNLEHIYVHHDNNSFLSVDGVLFNKDKNTLICYPQNKTEKIYVIPDGVCLVSDFAFKNCNNLERVVIPNSLELIGDYAFAGCWKLTQFLNLKKLKYIGDCAFDCCLSLSDLVLPNSVSFIGQYAFRGCINIKKINVPKELKSISDGLFAECTSLENVSLNDNVYKIGTRAFFGCENLKNIHLPNSIRHINDEAFLLSGLNTIHIGENIESMGRDVFKDVPLEKIRCGRKINPELKKFIEENYIKMVFDTSTKLTTFLNNI